MKLNELEIKIQIGSEEHLRTLFARCKQLLGPPESHVRQLDEYYDTPDGQLRRQDLVLRIRSIGNKKTIAMKSPRVDLPSGASSRIELEFLSAEENVEQQLLRQGLTPYESAEKERWTFSHGDCEIVLDTLPFIGSFVEIEGTSEEAIREVVNLLALSSFPVVRENYGELMKAKFQELQLPLLPLHATFTYEANCKAKIPVDN